MIPTSTKSLLLETSPNHDISEEVGERGLISLIKFLAVAIQLGLLVMVIRQFQLIDEAFYYYVAPLTLFGFLIHFFLPNRYRLPFFLILSLVSIITIFGGYNGAWMIGMGLVLIGVCHLPFSFLARTLILLALGLFLAFLRMNVVQTPWSESIWPVFASLFMFRIIIYMYDLRHQKEPMYLWRTLSYFFLLPNMALPFFPVVDYTTFRRTYYDQNQFKIYNEGIKWMIIGIIHLLFYRIVNVYMVIPPEEVVDTTSLIRYVVSSFMLYLQVSGRFHIVVGMLHLFGFHLPRTNHNYFLASSFTDFWRRINIYWKDFMMKIFYYPAYFQLRKWGAMLALVLSTVFVFFVTWFLHAYQWFWLNGTFLISEVDILFWTILAILILVNSIYEVKHGRKRVLGKQAWNLRSVIPLALKTVGTFTVISVLWSLWYSASLSEWLSLWSVVGITPIKIVWLLTISFIIILTWVFNIGNWKRLFD